MNSEENSHNHIVKEILPEFAERLKREGLMRFCAREGSFCQSCGVQDFFEELMRARSSKN